MVAVGEDGTNLNTGYRAGIITYLENILIKPLQWYICLLHFNELPLKHFIRALYGVATGPKSFCGSITNDLQNFDDLPVLDQYETIESDFPEVDRNLLSSDQKYLWT